MTAEPLPPARLPTSAGSALRAGLMAEILAMAVDTLRANKLRSALTILGVVIGVTAIVAMTSLIRGFGDQMRQLIRQMGSETVYVAKMSAVSFAAGRDFFELLRRPDLTEEDAKAIQIGAPSAALVSYQLGGGPAAPAGVTGISAAGGSGEVGWVLVAAVGGGLFVVGLGAGVVLSRRGE